MIHLHSNDPHDGTLRDLAPDLTPMLDILFILLVFFMLTAGAVFQSLDLNLPSSVTEELSTVNEPKHIMLEIKQDGYTIDGEALKTLEQLKQAVPKAIQVKKEHQLIIASDKDIPIEQLLRVLTYLQSQGIQAANILMKNEVK